MVDVVGFSTLTSMALEKGDSGAEAIAMEIGAYMGECIQIIEFYGGDVVKFLGDAVLVCFQPMRTTERKSSNDSNVNEESELTERQKNLLVRKSMECGLQLLARLSHYTVYLTAEERTKHRRPSVELRNMNNNRTMYDKRTPDIAATERKKSESDRNEATTSTSKDSHFLSMESLFPFWKKQGHKGRQRHRRSSDSSNLSGTTNTAASSIYSVKLELHMALSCGDIINIILGDMPNEAEILRHPSIYPQIRSYGDSQSAKPIVDEYFFDYRGRLEYAIGGDVVDALDEALSTAKAGELGLTATAYDIIKRQSFNLNFERRGRFFVISNIVEGQDHSVRKSSYPHPPSLRPNTNNILKKYPPPNNMEYLKALPGVKVEASGITMEPLIPRVRNTFLNYLPAEANPIYCKYVNRSALYRMQHSVGGHIPAQFREVTIMFISLGKTHVASSEGLLKAQQAVLVAIQALVKFEGMLQQFAIDDKGATLLAVFGLPPLSHERDALFAAKAALEIREQYLGLGFRGFAISLSTGVIFTSVIPPADPYRKDASIAGDTIVVAVRMLKFQFSVENVVCDIATRKQIGGLCEFEDYGENFVKGKPKPIQIFGISRFGPPERDKRISVLSLETSNDFIGYKTEMLTATDFIDDWINAPNHHLIVVSGPSGVGKSFFCNNLYQAITSHGVFSCWSSSAEVEKSSKYYLLKDIMLAVFEMIDSDRIPFKTKAKHEDRDAAIDRSSYQSLGHSSMGTSSDSTNSNPSSTSLRDNKDWYKRFAYGTMPVPTLGNTTENMEFTKEIVNLISRCLYKCGEEAGYLPLFKVIFTALTDVAENRYTRLLDGRARDILLAGVIVRMMHHVSKHVGLVIICDDVQWADTTSVKILQQIHCNCQKAMIIMATRPIKDYNVTFIEDFRTVGSHIEISLNGLNNCEIGEIILQNFDSGVNEISPEIVSVIQKRTGGNPLYVKNMAIILKDFNHVTVVEGELVPSSNSFDLEDLLGNFDYKRIIKMQFDRLDTNFQEFLTIACCLDQYFNLFEVGSVVSEHNRIYNDRKPEEIQRTIQSLDVYNFLQQVHSGDLSEGHIAVYTFAHITIPHSIYDMVSYEARIFRHRALAKYYESQLNKDNYIQLLGKITRHYMQTDNVAKQLYYLEALADLNMQTFQLPEATLNLQKIVEILDLNDKLLNQFGELHLSDIYRRLGICYTMRTMLKEGETYLFKALEILGHPWPNSEPQFLYKFYKNRLRQYQHRRWGILREYSSKLRREQGERQAEIMAQLSNIYLYTGNGRDFIYACLVGLNECEKLRDFGSIYTLFLGRNALLCWLNDDKTNSIHYIAKALRQTENNKTDSGMLTICALLCFAAGKFSNARDLLYQSIEACKTLGTVTDCQAFYRSVGLVVTMRIFEGVFNRSSTDLALLKQMAETAHANGDFEAEIWLGVYNIANAIVVDRIGDCAPYVSLLETHVKEAAVYNRIAIHGTLVCYYARIHMYESSKRHIQKLIHVLPSLTITPNIFPIFGLIFATMGFYSLVESGQMDISFDGSVSSYDKFIFGVSRLNHAFQQVKFWEFTQPCLYLARALPYVATKRIVEAYMVLRHGILEMHFIQEIKFLKAYYWANLGKLAFAPEDRIEWTERAKKDFEVLGIPHDTYCNPEPVNYYHRGLMADLIKRPYNEESSD
ncbi:hypothetical protein BDF20DRAFT_898573 [Mycotypha africana]|uniref:uncharacterized protein n=1 Tax=Mycotypha africana TaxID=64632 RepID=UPI0023003F77|nr:uncharacterized protein BDF20DRAFT_898573 [Mycotypha africana]KAI8968057.1 hypothetical protein BDF20DRAFT_898573 [Mycotypha africana]